MGREYYGRGERPSAGGEHEEMWPREKGENKSKPTNPNIHMPPSPLDHTSPLPQPRLTSPC